MRDNSDHINSLASSSVPAELPSLSRRGFLEMSAATAFLFGFSVPLRAIRAAAETATFAPNAFIRIDGQGEVTLIMPQVEMGQGTYTSISMILAEELDADWSSRQGRACTGRRDTLRQPGPGLPGDGRLHLDPRVLETSAPGRRRHARMFHRGRRAQLGCLDRGMPHGK